MSATALQKSIRHWERNLAVAKKSLGKEITSISSSEFKFGNSDFSMSGFACALCKKNISNCCLGCPVRKRTSKGNCYETPYQDLRYALLHRECHKVTKEIIMLVEAEVEFLKSLKKPKTSKSKKV